MAFETNDSELLEQLIFHYGADIDSTDEDIINGALEDYDEGEVHTIYMAHKQKKNSAENLDNIHDLYNYLKNSDVDHKGAQDLSKKCHGLAGILK